MAEYKCNCGLFFLPSLEHQYTAGQDVHRGAPLLCDGQGDPVDHPSHYNQYKGIEIIQLTEQMNFNRGNAVKYIARAGYKHDSNEILDLQKAVWYINREIERLENHG